MNLLQMSLSGAIFIFTVAVIRMIAVNKLPKIAFRFLWDIALIRLLLPVTFRFPFSFYSLVSRNVPVLDTFEDGITDFTAVVLPGQSVSIGNEAVQTVPDNALSFPVLPTIWLVGMAVLGGFFMVSYLRCRREFRTALPVETDFTSLWLREHPGRRTIAIRQLSGLSTPLSYGIFHPVILVPKAMDWGDQRQAQYVLFHEYVHIRRFDVIGKLIVSAALCIHWFNPLVWVMYVLFNRDIELSCDECVIRHFGGEDRRAYALALIRMEEQRRNPAPFGNYFSKSATEERIKAIMKFRKKSVFAFVLALIIVIAGAVAVFAMTPKTANTELGAVLRGEISFLYVSEKAAQPKNIDDVPSLFDPSDAYMTKIWEFAVLDLDGDGTAEVILSVSGVANDMGGSLILHQINGRVYGYTANYRALTGLKTDGTFSYSDPTGVVEGGICSIAAFTETGYTIDKISYGQGDYGEWNTFVVNHQAATEEAFRAVENEQSKKPDAVWHDFAAENIAAVQP